MRDDRERKTIIYGLFLALLLMGVMVHVRPVLAAGAATSGYCGAPGSAKRVTWSYADGTLTISGQGKMHDYKVDVGAKGPWAAYMDDIKKVVIEEGVTYIGEFAFFHYCSLRDVELPQSLKGIGEAAFGLCMRLTHIDLPDGLEDIGWYAFEYTPLTKVIVPGTVKQISEFSFSGLMLDSCIFHLDGILDEADRYSVVILNEGVQKIRVCAFGESYHIQTMYLPSTIEEVIEDKVGDTISWDYINAMHPLWRAFRSMWTNMKKYYRTCR